MKRFLYKAKPLLALSLAMSLCTTQVFAAEALSAKEQGVKEQPLQEVHAEEVAALALPQMSLQKALERAEKHSAALRDLADTLEYMQETDEDIYDRIGFVNIPNYEYTKWVNDGWHGLVSSIFALDNGMKQTKLAQEAAKLGVEAGVKSSFTAIVLLEDGLELAKQSVEQAEIAYQQGKTKNELGLLSTYELEKLQVAAKQAQDNLTNLESQLEQQYISFNNLIGENADKRFDFVYDIDFTPYEMSRPMEQYIADKTKNDLSIRIQELKVEQAKFNYNYRAVSDTGATANQNELSYDQAKRNLKTAKETMEKEIRNAYLDIKQLETEYSSAQADLTKAQADYRVAQVNLQAGNVTKTVVEQAEMGVIAAENALKQLVYQHDIKVFLFENPSLLSGGSSQ